MNRIDYQQSNGTWGKLQGDIVRVEFNPDNGLASIGVAGTQEATNKRRYDGYAANVIYYNISQTEKSS